MAREHAPPAAEPVSPSSASSASHHPTREPSPPPLARNSAQPPYGLYPPHPPHPPCQNAGPPPPHPPPAHRPLVQKIKSMSCVILHLLILVVALIGIGFAIAVLVKGAKADNLWRGGDGDLVDDDWFDRRWVGHGRHGHHGRHGRHGHDRDFDRDFDRDRDHYRGPGRDGDYRHGGGYRHDRRYFDTSISSVVIFVLSLLWSLANLVVRHILKWKAGFFSIAHVAVSFCLWIASTIVGSLSAKGGGFFGGGGARAGCDTYRGYDNEQGTGTAGLRDGLRAGRRLRPGRGGWCRHSAAKSPLFIGITVLILIAALVELAIFVFACVDLWSRRKARRVAPPPPPPPVACVPAQQPVCASA
ncbi:hypothetical protein EsDP_00006520 [Epichloe bromicola]|uniref:Uncharacterized protein n=1 Tax=Epichloe bromicola TaxID=79588 RepID=A0ABQ0CXV9_9HYPO